MSNLDHPACLVVGPRSAAIRQVEEDLKKIWCPEQGCRRCSVCLGVAARQYYLLHWMVPGKQAYTMAQVHEVLQVLSFLLDEHEQCYFVFECAELLSFNSAPALLKALEEPPPGYHFVLLTESVEVLLPTIVSRCVVQQVFGEHELGQWDAFLAFFCARQRPDLKAFERECERASPAEYEARKFVEVIMAYWHGQSRVFVGVGDEQRAVYARQRLEILQEALGVLPMPGSAKLFWRTLFLKMVFL